MAVFDCALASPFAGALCGAKNHEVFLIIFRIYLNSAGGYGTLRVRKGRREHVRICNGGQAGAENAGI